MTITTLTRRSMPRTLAAVTLLMTALLARPAFAQVQAPASDLPSNERLDAVAAARDWKGLGTALSSGRSPADLNRRMNWMRAQSDAGAGFFINLMYAKDLWGVGSALSFSDPTNDLRLTSGMVALYTYELIVIDGARCKDRTAPDHRLQQLLTTRAQTFAYMKAQSDATKAKTVEIALALERRTAPLRREDDLVCRDGSEQLEAGVLRGTQRQAQATQGYYGRVMEVTPPPGWMPTMVPPSIYQPMQAQARTTMKAALLRLIQ